VPTALSRRFARGRTWTVALWILAAAFVAAEVMFQVRGRGWLLWDEAARVEAGQGLVFALDSHSAGSVWTWINGQTFYPFLAPALHGLLMFGGADPVAAAWIPGVLAYCGAGVLAARLALGIGAGRPAQLAAAVLVWITPLVARLSAGAFTEPLGACIYLGLLILLLAAYEAPSLAVAGALALLTAVASWLKWDYGLAALLLVAASGLIVPVGARAAASRRCIGGALIGSTLLIVALLLFNFQGKAVGLFLFTRQAQPGAAAGRLPDFLFYPHALVNGEGVGLSPILGVLMLAASLLAAFQARREWRLRPVVLVAALLYLIYSAATIRQPRYLATMIPVLAVLTAYEAERALLWLLQARPRLRRAGVGALLATTLLVLVAQLPQLGARLPSLNRNQTADAARAYIARHVADAPGPLLLVGPTNEVSVPAVELLRDRMLGPQAPPTYSVPEAPSTRRPMVFQATLAVVQPGEVISVCVQAGSDLDTPDDRGVWLSQPDYCRMVSRLEHDGALRQAGHVQLDHGGVVIDVALSG
jgi:hypothetical protein